jgi:hypothetical protein
MNNARLERLLRRAFPQLQGERGCWCAKLDDELEVYVLTDEPADRVRILIPVAQAVRRDNDLLWVLLVANFDLTQDARYAVHDGLVWCTLLTHLSSLSEPQLKSALEQVIRLARNTGSTFSSAAPVAEHLLIEDEGALDA